MLDTIYSLPYTIYMKLLIFTKGDSPETRSAKELGALLEGEKYEVEYLDSENPDSEQRAELYDLYSYPSFVAIRDDGSEIECWRGVVPIAGDVKHFLNQ